MTRPGQPRIGRPVRVTIRESDEARALSLGESIASFVRTSIDVRCALLDGATLATLRKIATSCEEREAAREGRA